MLSKIKTYLKSPNNFQKSLNKDENIDFNTIMSFEMTLDIQKKYYNEIFDNEESMAKLVKRDGEFLKFGSTRIRKNEQIMLAALSNNAHSIKYGITTIKFCYNWSSGPKNIWDDEDIVFKIIKVYPDAIVKVSKRLRDKYSKLSWVYDKKTKLCLAEFGDIHYDTVDNQKSKLWKDTFLNIYSPDNFDTVIKKVDKFYSNENPAFIIPNVTFYEAS